ncbi:nitrate ABC transporter ATP-binding protein [Alkalinema sp. FACHB-956]|uniref:ABC transporter ATP-binding/substrate-binding protein n=1 Tax=Alkalinema sp. FACHB-956 TaxID=2692768 RepID=UPI0016864C32|nr:nitrate ABC transporter ATP-binding protein [Alkalinema sp. FACHB-956]MBD2328202.1 ABC transporter substrate-binding protein [Alkalinema sp. FACHB-956]
MANLVEVDHIDKIYPLPNGGQYVALKNVDLNIREGEFVSLIGHSGCGKSTLLNIIAGFEQASAGGVVLEGREIKTPGPDRMMVFQNYSLLPWLTVRQNIALAVNKVLKNLPEAERKDIVEEHINLVGLRHAADKKPKELSGGMKQRTAIGRALAIRPRVLLLDEPFGALDALTRGNLQEQLMEICQSHNMTCVMVTHDVDEALLLSDRIVMLTNGPEAHIGRILDVPIPRPRRRMEVVNHPEYYHLRAEVISFLNQQKRAKRRQKRQAAERPTIPAVAALQGLEQATLTLGYVPTVDAAPLIVAKEKGLFQKYGFETVNLVAQTSWQAIADGVADRSLDAAQMLAGMPLSMALGAGNKERIPVTTSLVLARNGNAITLKKGYYDRGVRNLADLKQAITATADEPHTFGVVDDASMGSLLLRYWLAAGGIDPDQDVNLSVLSSADMKNRLALGDVDGYLAAEPWNIRAVQNGTGFVVATDLEIWNGHQNKVLGVREDWAEQNPATHLALVKALIEACQYCDDRRNREEIVQLLAREEYVNRPAVQLRPGFIHPYNRGTEAEPEMLLRFNQFYVEQSTCPRRLEALWIMTQLARWGITPFPKNWVEVLERIYRVDIYGQAARALGIPDTEPDRIPVQLFDGVVFNPDDPMAYLNSLAIRREIRVEDILLDSATNSRVA